MARSVGDRVTEAMGHASGTIISVDDQELPGEPVYGIAWDDDEYAGETWTEADLLPVEEGDY